MEVIEQQLVDAFTEWDRRLKEEPEKFESPAVCLLKWTSQAYGEACAPYFWEILKEQS